jgi:hypothetical protein
MAEMPKILSARTCGTITIDKVEYVAYRVGVYQPFARKADGVKTLRLVGNVGPHFQLLGKAAVFGEAYAAKRESEYFYFERVKHGTMFSDLPDGVHTYFELMEAME